MSEDTQMPLIEHLEELRRRIIYSIAAWVLASSAAYYFTPRLIAIFTGMVKTKLVFINPMEAFLAYLKIALLLGLFIALPYILYQALAFIVPGLEKHEKKWVLCLVPVAVLLFFAGAFFACCVLIPITLRFFLSFATTDLVPMITIGGLMSFVLTFVILCGLIFQTPLVILFLALIGLVNSSLLREKRKYMVIAFFIVAAVATPTPDAFTQVVVTIPMIVLYEFSILLISVLEKRKRREKEPEK